MGSNETAAATTGGPRVIGVFGNGAPSGPNYYFFWIQIGSRTPSGVGLVVGKRLHRIRRRCGGLLPLKANLGLLAKVARTAEKARNRPKMIEAAVHAA